MADLSWQDAVAAFDRLQSETKDLVFPAGDGEIRFRVRAISQLERDQIEAKGLRMRKRRRGDTVTADELRALKTEYIRVGVVSGPEGFAPTEENIALLPAHVRDALADAVQGFVELEEETRIGFR
ncbi:MAG: hypothetical protein PHU37_10890 [Methanoculleus chikugoensis]|nr:hypothetical protein [Methanoculleus chikugoensis]